MLEVILWEYGRGRFIKLFRYLGFTDDEAADLWTETYINLLISKCETYNPEKAPFTIWLRVVVKRVGLYHLRRRRRYSETSLEFCFHIPCDEVFPEKNMSGELEPEIWVNTAALLKSTDRLIIWERVVDRLSFDLLAESRGITPRAARMRFSRALARLRRAVEGLHPGELRRRTKRFRRRYSPRVAAAEVC